jgi:thiopurine S-methyltransferase
VEREFWLDKWARDEIGFHRGSVNPVLEEHWASLGVPAHRGVLVPLCGKSLDMRWLEAVGHPVWGVELAEQAVRAYFAEGGETPELQHGNYLRAYRGSATTIYCGDFRDLAAPDIKGTGAVYDRGALVALPPRLRAHYADHVQRVVPEHTVMLLVSLEYEQAKVPGPPFSVPEAEIRSLYGERCSVETLDAGEARELPPRFDGLAVRECVYRIVKKR